MLLMLRNASRLLPASCALPCHAPVQARAASFGEGAVGAFYYSSQTQSAKKSFPVGLTAAAGVGAAALAYYAFGTKSEPAAVASVKETVKQLQCALDPKNFRPYALKSSSDVNYNTKKFTFALDDPNQNLGLPVASCVVTRFEKADGKGYVVRPYTPISTDDDRGVFDLLIKVYKGGPMSEHVFGMKAGDKLEVKGPIPKIEYKPNHWDKIGMIAGGTGLTPMLQVIRRILNNPADKTKVSLLFANQERRDILLKDELDNLAKKHPDKFQVHYTLDKPPKGWSEEKGFVNKNMIEKYMPSKDENAIVFVCGPDGMMAHVSGTKTPDYQQGEVGGLLAQLGYVKEKVYKF